jgi:hypothetical protein
MAKTIFNADSPVSVSWLNAMQNISFVANPQNDGQYPLLKYGDFESGLFDNRYLGVAGGTVTAQKKLLQSPEAIGGGMATLSELQSTLASTIKAYAADSTLALNQSGFNVAVTNRPVDSRVELGGGLVILKGATSLPAGSGDFLVQAELNTVFSDPPFILSCTTNTGNVILSYQLGITVNQISCVCTRLAAQQLNEELRWAVLGRISP